MAEAMIPSRARVADSGHERRRGQIHHRSAEDGMLGSDQLGKRRFEHIAPLVQSAAYQR